VGSTRTDEATPQDLKNVAGVFAKQNVFAPYICRLMLPYADLRADSKTTLMADYVGSRPRPSGLGAQ